MVSVSIPSLDLRKCGDAADEPELEPEEDELEDDDEPDDEDEDEDKDELDEVKVLGGAIFTIIEATLV